MRPHPATVAPLQTLQLPNNSTSPISFRNEINQISQLRMGLPLRMSNLHAPTVPSGPTSSAATNGQVGKLSFVELEKQKLDMEAELKALGGVLESVGQANNSFCVVRNTYR
jgi:hypothetical protein